jgi:hypothetical protein
MTNTGTLAQPAITETGIPCSNCSAWENGKRIQRRHATSKDVAVCFYLKFHAPKAVDLPAPAGIQVAVAAATTEAKVINHQPKAFGRWSAKCYRKGCDTHMVLDRPFTLKCNQHGKVVRVKAKQLIGTVSTAAKHHCDSSCIGAVGPVCVCACGGQNHGVGWLTKV